MKKIIWIIVVIVLVVAGYYIYKSKAGAPVLSEDSNSSVVVSGTVSNINTEGVAVDGPALVSLTTQSGVETIAVPSMGRNLCAAKDTVVDVYTLKAGDRVEVRGTRDPEGRIVPCEDASHYMRLVTQ